jgi:hypothetical protein
MDFTLHLRGYAPPHVQQNAADEMERLVAHLARS